MMITEPMDSGDSLAARDRVRRARGRAMSPAERLAAMQRLLAKSREILERSPAGLAHFRRRNFAARAIGREARMKAHDS